MWKKGESGKYDQKTQKIYLNPSLSPEQKIKTQMLSDLKNYFENLGGLYENDPLVWFAKSKANVNYIIPEPQPLMVADSGANNE